MASMCVSEEDLSCPVCSEVYKDPVLLTCTHSICTDCLKRFWDTKGSRECPVCRRRCSKEMYPINLALKNLCETFRLEGRQRDPICSLHRSELRLLCEDDKQLVCVVCRDSKLHRNHKFIPISEVAQERKVQAQKTEEQIKEEFENLHQFLRDEEAARIAALREEEEQKSQMMKEKIEMLSNEISSLSATIEIIKNETEADDISFLQDYKTTVEIAQCTLQDPERLSGALINVAKHLGNLQFRVWEKMKDLVQYTPVILDPNTAHPDLILSEDLTSVRYSSHIQQLPDNPERFHWYYCVLGSEGFNSGTHCWDVEVNDSGDWHLGLVTESTSRSGGGSPWSGFWSVCYSNGRYRASSPGTAPIPLTVEQKPQRIRVQLDWDRGELSFTNPDNNTHLHTYTHTFTERVFPCFCAVACSLTMLPVKPAVMVDGQLDIRHNADPAAGTH